MIADERITLAGEILTKEAGPEATVILFGSHAHGTARPDSDIDFLVIEPKVTGRHGEMVRLRRCLRGIDAAIDVLVYSREEANRWGQIPGTAVQDALQDGTVLGGG